MRTPNKLLVLILAAAACDNDVGGGGVLAPTVESVPERTRSAEINLQGTRGPDTAVWVQVTQRDAAELSVAAKDERWSGVLELEEGVNTFVIFASDASGRMFSQNVGPFDVERDSRPPIAPGVDPYDSAVYLGTASAVSLRLSGTKDIDANLLADGIEVVELDNQTTWTYDFTVRLGANSLTLSSMDELGNESEPVTLDILGTNVPAPTLNPIISPTNLPNQTISGGKMPGTSVHLRRPGQPDELISPQDLASTWSYALTLRQGTNIIAIFARRSDTPHESASVSTAIVLDNVPPANPRIDGPSSIETGEPIVTFTGSRATDGGICVRYNTEPECTEIIAPDAECLPVADGCAVSIDVPLNVGANYVCFSSRDLAGNESGEVCVSVQRIGGPPVSIQQPLSGAVVRTATLQVIAEVVSGGGGAAVTSVQVCLDGAGCADAANTGGDTWSHTLDLSGLSNGSTHTVAVRATNAIGGVTVEERDFFYLSGVLVMSDNEAWGHSVNIDAAVDAAGNLHVIWADECMQFGSVCTESNAGNLPFDIFYRAVIDSRLTAIRLISDVPADAVSGDGDGDSTEPRIAIAPNGQLHIVWTEGGSVQGSGGDHDIVHRTLDSATGVAGAISVLTPEPFDTGIEDTAPVVAIGADGIAHVVWERRTSSTDYDVYITSRSASGVWSAPLLVSNDVANDGNSRFPDVAADADAGAHVVWQDNGAMLSSGTDPDIFYRKVREGVLGAMNLVTDSVRDNTVSSLSILPSVAVDQAGRAHIVWQDNVGSQGAGSDADIFYRTYDNAGVATAYQLVSGESAETSATPRVSITPGGDPVVVWAERQVTGAEGESPSNTDTFYSIGFNTGADWFFVAPGTQAAANIKQSMNPLAIAERGYLHLLWEDNTTVIASDRDRSGQLNPPLTSEELDTDVFYLVNELP